MRSNPNIPPLRVSDLANILKPERVYEILKKLEALGFTQPFTERVGPCDLCGKETTTYWVPNSGKWQCESCSWSGI